MWLKKISKLLVASLLFLSPRVFAVDGLYLGARAGFVGLNGIPSLTYNNALGFGGDIGLRTSFAVDIIGHFQTSSHASNGGLTIYTGNVTAEVHILPPSPFDLTLGAGPGFYWFKPAVTSTETDFGINFGGALDFVVDESLVVGIGSRYHAVFSGVVGGSFYDVMARLGYIISF